MVCPLGSLPTTQLGKAGVWEAPHLGLTVACQVNN
jgi:hypothetical protein